MKLGVSMENKELVQQSLQMQNLQKDNEKIRKELRKIREENVKLKQIIAYGNISTLETLIEQYMDYSRIYLKKIAMEIHITDYEKDSTEKVLELIEHLEHIENELHKMIEMKEEGRVADNENLRKNVKIAREMLPRLEQIIHLKIDKEKSDELAKVLSEFAPKLRKCL
jgi:hypothetical protein